MKTILLFFHFYQQNPTFSTQKVKPELPEDVRGQGLYDFGGRHLKLDLVLDPFHSFGEDRSKQSCCGCLRPDGVARLVLCKPFSDIL
ncbi:hypothetical protein L6452_03554 [Arctium lappa]|uniref:Uncharacterized protein n=1 Tax=Arctium lappa TaxID=4217 RepID=A0ACB9FMN0_ARCLA|nr:hypothetical protein L6452_03554 [Arctium lappa]